jgi:hypothetical protein
MKEKNMSKASLAETEVDLSEIHGPTAPVAIDLSKYRKKTPQRKAKVSRVPADYDPFALVMALPRGYQRPKEHCWVAPNVVRPVDLSELSPLWRMDVAEMGTSDRKHRFLASVVAMVGGEYYVRRKANGKWVPKKKQIEVKIILENEWCGKQTELNIRRESIETFFANGAFVVLDGVAFIPGAGPYVEYNGDKCLNTYYQPQLAYLTTMTLSDETQALIEMIVKNLLGRTDGTLDDWFAEIEDDTPSDIRWLFHWLANLYQRPGNSLPTALWFIGPAQGVGKSVFASGLRMLVGQANAKNVSAEEFKGDWTDFLTNSSLFLCDEVDFSSRKEANNKLKRLVGNDTVAARKRNVGEFQLPAVSNFVFTTNNIQPLALDRDDRRNTFFETNGSAGAKKRAQNFFNLGPDGIRSAWEGLAEILHGIVIDDGLIGRAFETDVKRRMIDNGLDAFDEWFQSEEVLEGWPTSEFAPVSWIKKRYIAWAKENAYQGCTSTSYCQRKIDEMVSEGLMSNKQRKTLSDGSKRHGYVRLDPDREVDEVSAGNCDVIKEFRKSKKFLETQSKVMASLGR